MSDPCGFTFRRNKDGCVAIFHHERLAASLNGSNSAGLMDEIAAAGSSEAQHILARLTGNYKRGNERLAKSHHRNRG